MTTFIIIILAICLTIQYVVALVKEHFWLAIFFTAEIAGWARSDFFWISSFNKICSQMLCNLTIDTSPEICYTI